MASRTQGVAVTKDTSILSLTEELKTGALTINAPADAEVAICEQMADGQIAVYKADSTAAQEDGTVDSVFHLAMTDAKCTTMSAELLMSHITERR